MVTDVPSFMGEIILLLLVLAWVVWRWTGDRREAQSEARRREEKVEIRRRVLAGAPNSASALETLGDAMREADHLEEAISCYQEALDRYSESGLRGDGGAGQVAGGGLENKLRLTRFELQEEVSPSHGQTLQTRQQVCRQCGALGLPQHVECSTCGSPLPVDSIFDTLRHPGFRTSIFWETVQAVAAMAIVLTAVLVASWMPPLMRFSIVVAAIFIIPFRLLKHITQV